MARRSGTLSGALNGAGAGALEGGILGGAAGFGIGAAPYAARGGAIAGKWLAGELVSSGLVDLTGVQFGPLRIRTGLAMVEPGDAPNAASTK